VLTAVILKGLPHTDVASLVPAYAVVFVANGALNAWPAPACNNPIFAEVRAHAGFGYLVRTPECVRRRGVGVGMRQPRGRGLVGTPFTSVALGC